MTLLEKVAAIVKPSTSSDEIDAIDLLEEDHGEVNALFKDYEMLAEGNGDARSGTDRCDCRRTAYHRALHPA